MKKTYKIWMIVEARIVDDEGNEDYMDVDGVIQSIGEEFDSLEDAVETMEEIHMTYKKI